MTFVQSTVLTSVCLSPGAPGCGLPAAAAAAVRGHGGAGRRARRGAARPGPRRGVAARLRAPAARPAHAGARPRGAPSLGPRAAPPVHLRPRCSLSPAVEWLRGCVRQRPGLRMQTRAPAAPPPWPAPAARLQPASTAVTPRGRPAPLWRPACCCCKPANSAASPARDVPCEQVWRTCASARARGGGAGAGDGVAVPGRGHPAPPGPAAVLTRAARARRRRPGAWRLRPGAGGDVSQLGWYTERILRERRCACGEHISACSLVLLVVQSTPFPSCENVQPNLAPCATSHAQAGIIQTCRCMK